MRARNYGLDVCRILSMFFIVLLHVIGRGGISRGVLETTNGAFTIEYWSSRWLYICALCSVDMFGIMSGYFGICKKVNTTYRMFELIAITLFFSCLSTLGFALFHPTSFKGIKDIITALFPPLAGRYWYITCFIPVLILQPFINKMLMSLSTKQHKALLFITLCLFSVIPSVLYKDFFAFSNGYSFAWLFVLYILGAYLKRSNFLDSFSRAWFPAILFFIISFVLLFGNVFLGHISGNDWNYMVNYTSPFTLLMGLCIIIFLNNIHLVPKRKALEKTSQTAFDVYIIHSHILIYNILLNDLFKWSSQLPWYGIIVVALTASAIIYVVCTIIGMFRIQLFKRLRINRLIEKLSNFTDRIIYPCLVDTN